MSGYTLGYALKNGTVLNTVDVSNKNWDFVMFDRNYFNDHPIDPPSAGDALDYVYETTSAWGYGIGPWLIRNGSTTNISAEISEGGYTGLAASSAYYANGDPIPRAGIGYVPGDDLVVHLVVVDEGVSLTDLQTWVAEFPDIDWFLAFDGGHSVGLLEREITNNIIQYDSGPMQAAFVV